MTTSRPGLAAELNEPASKAVCRTVFSATPGRCKRTTARTLRLLALRPDLYDLLGWRSATRHGRGHRAGCCRETARHGRQCCRCLRDQGYRGGVRVQAHCRECGGRQLFDDRAAASGGLAARFPQRLPPLEWSTTMAMTALASWNCLEAEIGPLRAPTPRLPVTEAWQGGFRCAAR